MKVGLVLVSHSEKLAQGLAELAEQMAPEVKIIAAGGLEDGGLGTDYDKVVSATQKADSGAGVVLLYDLGSAQMTAELAVESAIDAHSTIVVDAPFVEGAIAAAVAAQSGVSSAQVADAAAAALNESAENFPVEQEENEIRADLVLANKVGLHARPAAMLVRSLADLDAEVGMRFREQEVDARSVMALMTLGAGRGDRIHVWARGPQAEEAVRRIQDLVKRDFDEALQTERYS